MADSLDPIGPLRAALAGRYEIEREIGQGAFATVYLAKDSRHDRKLALKVLNADPSSETGELRFIREIRMLARLQHPNILPLHDSGHFEAFLYYLMPYVSGETLREKMGRERHLPIDAAVRISCEAADALAYAHAQGIIHRDIKPENILLSGGHAIVADFGIARAIDVAGVQQLTRTGMGGPGTPAYMSPEQLMGDRQLDGRSDIYSLGCVLCEMLTGKPPFAGKEGFVKRFTEDAPRPSGVRKEIPSWLDEVVARTLARDPDKRFGRAEELVRALSDHASSDLNPLPGSKAGSTIKAKPTSGRATAGRRNTDSQTSVGPIAYRLTPTAANRLREAEQPSIAVLPFANMSENPDNEYFSDGITEEILNALSRIPTLKVAARTSTFALKNKSMNITEIGQLLNVNTVLEGSVRRMGQRVRISAQLINARDGYHIWSERYDREIEDVFAIQDEIARTIVARLKVKLTAAQDEALGTRNTQNIEAYELYLRGRHCWYRWNIKGMLEKAIRHYQHALVKDPDYALAYSGLADAYSVPGLWGFQPPSTALPKALAAATRAVELAPSSAESRTSLGFVQLLSLDWEGAEASLLHAIDLNPRHALAHSFHAWLLSIVDRQREAAEAARLGQELDPLSPATNGIAALVSYHGRQFEQAIAECQRALERDRASFLALLAMTLSYAANGMYAEAISHAQRGVTLSPEVNLLRSLLAVVYAMAGDRPAAEKVLADLLERSQREYVGPTMISWIYANMDQPDLAFDWLGKATSARDCTLGFGIRAPVYDRISGDSRFRELLTGLGLA
ncbi:MAG: eukaryotic-like serine/threonine-protein kinase [Gemmatimonadaceae bacterium]|nr:eukaryotic-like serine/threonine-protein kinase [Gemmatimonadaceae bacterium]